MTTYTAVQMGRLLSVNESTVRTWGKRFPEFVPTLGPEGAPPYLEQAVPVLAFIRDRYGENLPTERIREALGQNFPYVAETAQSGAIDIPVASVSPLTDPHMFEAWFTTMLHDEVTNAVAPLLTKIEQLEKTIADQAAAAAEQQEQRRSNDAERTGERYREVLAKLDEVKVAMDERKQAEQERNRTWFDRILGRNKAE